MGCSTCLKVSLFVCNAIYWFFVKFLFNFKITKRCQRRRVELVVVVVAVMVRKWLRSFGDKCSAAGNRHSRFVFVRKQSRKGLDGVFNVQCVCVYRAQGGGELLCKKET